MIKRFTDETTFSDDLFAKLEKVVSDENAEQTLQVSDSEEQIKQAELEAKIRGMNVTVEKVNDKYHLKTQKQERIKYREAMNSGRFKKLAWGRYCFQRQANEPLGFEKYDFDDGSIWRVMTGTDGKEYLVKDVQEDNENKVIRRNDKSVTADNKNMIVDEKNVKTLANILYDNMSDEFIGDMLRVAKNDVLRTVNNKFNDFINDEVSTNKFISSPTYLSELKTALIANINNTKLGSKEQMSNFIIKHSNQYISKNGK